MLTRIALGIAFYEITESKKLMEKITGKRVDSFCYPRGYANERIINIVKKYYREARNTGVGNIQRPKAKHWITPTVHVAGIKRKEYEGKNWLTEAKELLKLAKEKPDSVYHIWGHSWEIERYNAWEDLESLLREVVS
jgi:peptidoglycan/xylan/chitin deacetylase (PgdA/CDA1 family)